MQYHPLPLEDSLAQQKGAGWGLFRRNLTTDSCVLECASKFNNANTAVDKHILKTTIKETRSALQQNLKTSLLFEQKGT